MANHYHSKKRDAILECVRSTDAHPSADWVFEHVKEQIPDISLATVYRNLSMFKEEGTIISLGTVAGLERFDRRVDPHCHLVCTCCHRVVDVEGLTLPKELCEAAENEVGAQVTSWDLKFIGLCEQCTTKA